LQHSQLFRMQRAAGCQRRQLRLAVYQPAQAGLHAERHGNLAQVEVHGMDRIRAQSRIRLRITEAATSGGSISVRASSSMLPAQARPGSSVATPASLSLAITATS
jgi:hypothetical protein